METEMCWNLENLDPIPEYVKITAKVTNFIFEIGSDIMIFKLSFNKPFKTEAKSLNARFNTKKKYRF